MDLSIIHASPFYELAAILALAATLGIFGQMLRQPMIVSFIAVGVIAGPSVLDVVQSKQNIELLAELGIAVLLFLVGLKLDLKLIRTLGPVALATGLGQVLFTSIIGFVIGLALGMDAVTALYIAVALTFSSTIIIVKLLSDKREVDSLHGRIAISFLIVQDLVVVLAMMMLSALGVGAEESDASIALHIATVLIYGGGMLVFVLLFIRYLAKPLVGRIAHSSELLITFSIAWAALLAALGSHFGFSKELGGLLAGISLASTPFREAIVARLSSLRDFLLLFFFIALGAQLDLGLLGAQILPALLFSLFVLIGNPLIVMIIMGFMGYRKRTGFLAGLTVAQISEFSLIFIAMGMTLGHVSPESLGLVTLVGMITISLSVYMISFSHKIYARLEPFLDGFERAEPFREKGLEDASGHSQARYDVVLFGLGRYGKAIATDLIKEGFRVLAVDFNPDEAKRWREQGGDAIYGDASDPAFIANLSLGEVAWVVAAMPQHDLGLTHEDPRLILLDELKRQQYQGRVAVSTQYGHDVAHLRERGAALVFQPFHDAAEQAVVRIKASSV